MDTASAIVAQLLEDDIEDAVRKAASEISPEAVTGVYNVTIFGKSDSQHSGTNQFLPHDEKMLDDFIRHFLAGQYRIPMYAVQPEHRNAWDIRVRTVDAAPNHNLRGPFSWETYLARDKQAELPRLKQDAKRFLRRARRNPALADRYEDYDALLQALGPEFYQWARKYGVPVQVR